MPELRTEDGTALALTRWPATAPPRGRIVLVHGLGEHIGRYGAVVQRLGAAGWQVCGYDQRGHGRSGGPRGGIAQADSLLSDLGQVLQAERAIARLDGDGPLLLLGHSLGGLLVGRYVAEGLAPRPAAWWQPVDGLVMSSPALDPGMRGWQKALLAGMLKLAPDLPAHNGLKPAWISRDAAVVRAYRADPLVHARITARLAQFIVQAGQQVLAAAPRWAVPTQLLYAGADRCVSPAGSDAFAATAPTMLLQARRFDGLSHEIFNEPERDAVLDALCSWLGRWPAATLH